MKSENATDSGAAAREPPLGERRQPGPDPHASFVLPRMRAAAPPPRPPERALLLACCCSLLLRRRGAEAIAVRAGARVPSWGCGVGPSPHQSWEYDATNQTFRLNDPWAAPNAPPLCLTAEALTDGAFVDVQPCGQGSAAQRQLWALDVANASLGRYVTVTPAAELGRGLVMSTMNFDIRLFDAAVAGDSTWWITQYNATPPVSCTPQDRITHPGSCICACSPEEFRANTCSSTVPTGAIVHSGSGWCADAGPWDRFPCDPAQPQAQENITSLPFCNSSLPRSERVAASLSGFRTAICSRCCRPAAWPSSRCESRPGTVRPLRATLHLSPSLLPPVSCLLPPVLQSLSPA